MCFQVRRNRYMVVLLDEEEVKRKEELNEGINGVFGQFF